MCVLECKWGNRDRSPSPHTHTQDVKTILDQYEEALTAMFAKYACADQTGEVTCSLGEMWA